MNDNTGFLLRAAGSLAALLLLLCLHYGGHAATPRTAATIAVAQQD
jgi:hypothetical protein